MFILAIWRLNEPPIHPREKNSITLGIKRFGSGNYDRAYRNIRKTLSLNPDNTKARELKEFLRLIGIPKYASPLQNSIEYFNQLSQKFPASPHLKMVGAELFLSMNNPAQAKLLLLDAVTEYPDIPHNWYVLGISQRSLGEKKNAITSITMAIELDPQQRYFKALGDCYFLDEKWESALKHYETAISGRKLALSAKIGYLRSLIFSGKYFEAAEFGQKLYNTISTLDRLPQKERIKARLISSFATYETVTDLSRKQLIEYIETLLSVVDKLSANEALSPASILGASDPDIKPVLELDFSEIF